MQPMLEVITRILNEHGEDVFYNMHRTNAMLLDLAPDSRKERILVRSFVEMDGFEVLKHHLGEYPLAEKRLVQGLTDFFSIEKSAAVWVVRLFGHALGLINEMPELENTPQNEITIRKQQVDIGRNHVVAVSVDGTVFAGGDNDFFQCDVSQFKNIVQVAAGDSHTLGLTTDGKVISAGSNAFDECDVYTYKDISAVYAFGRDSVLVTKDGSVISTGQTMFNVSEFSEIVHISKFPNGLLGVRNDGTLTLTGYVTDEESASEIAWLYDAQNVTNVVSSYEEGSVVLTKDGKILKSNQPDNYFAQWGDIVNIANVSNGFAILRADGTVRVLPFDRSKQRLMTDADKWSEIVQIFGGYRRLIGLKKDGSLCVAYTHAGWLMLNSSMSIDYCQSWHPVGIYE